MVIEPKDTNMLGKLDTQEFLMSETFSDITIECQGETFPAHRIVIAGKNELKLKVAKKQLS